MALPRELLQYAENLYRRFPEEFLALGAPGLEEFYDLRPNGTWTRNIQETPSEKVVEVKLRRWQHGAPYMGGAGMLHDPMAQRFQHPQQMSLPSYGPPPQAAWQPMAMPPPPSIAAPWESGGYGHEAPAHIVSCLSRLETALSALTPQIEVLHARAMQPQASPMQMQTHCIQHQQIPTSPGGGSSSDKIVHAQMAAQNADGMNSPPQSEGTSLRTSPIDWTIDRPMAYCPGLALLAAQKPQPNAEKLAEAVQQKSMPHPTVKRLDSPMDAVESKTEVKHRPVVNINAVRVSPGIHDPQSPRSPGRYSAWK